VPPLVGVLIAIVTGLATNLPLAVRADDEVFASLGTGQMNGVYYPVSKAICEIVNRDLRTHSVRCSPEVTPGSVYNVRAIQSGELEFGIIQSDVQFAAYKGQGVDRQAVCRSAIGAVPVPGARHRHCSCRFAHPGSCGTGRPTGQCGQPGHRYPGDLGRHRSRTRLA
jgi:hypothetical protein